MQTSSSQVVVLAGGDVVVSGNAGVSVNACVASGVWLGGMAVLGASVGEVVTVTGWLSTGVGNAWVAVLKSEQAPITNKETMLIPMNSGRFCRFMMVKYLLVSPHPG